MKFTAIDLKRYPRKSQYQHFMNVTGGEISFTVNADVTRLYHTAKERGAKFNAAMIYASTDVANRHEEFRTRFNANGDLGFWDYLNPVYSVFHPEHETYSKIWTEWLTQTEEGVIDGFAQFYRSYLTDLEQYGAVNKYYGKPKLPKNAFAISAVPWIQFTQVYYHSIEMDRKNLAPFLVWGRFFQEEGRIKLPMMMRVNHAVCDGFHVSRFFEEVEQMSETAADWLCIEEERQEEPQPQAPEVQE